MYFEKAGKQNTIRVLELARQRAQELCIHEVVVASTRGETACRAYEVFQGSNIKLVAVTEHAGFAEPFQHMIADDRRRDLEAKHIPVVCGSHALSGVERGLAKKMPGVYPVLLIAETLRLFGQGLKVAVEITIMAADAGHLSGKPVIAVGGTGEGADTAIVITPANMNRFFEMKIHEIICKPNLHQ